VPRQEDRPKRSTTLEIRVGTITLAPPERPRGRRPLTINVLWAHELDPPADIEDSVDWKLYTTLPLDTLQQCLGVLGLYARRWVIEDYHLTLKSGCSVEKTQLGNALRIEKLIALSTPVAIKILQLRKVARTEPEKPCTEILTSLEWRALQTFVLKQPLSPDQPPPTIRQAVLWIGRLGGHLGRKGDGMPGVRTLWRGWRRVRDIVECFRLPGFG
jgi:hypothetical protein